MIIVYIHDSVCTCILFFIVLINNICIIMKDVHANIQVVVI